MHTTTTDLLLTLQLFAAALSGGAAKRLDKEAAYDNGWDLYEDFVMEEAWMWGDKRFDFLVYARKYDNRLEIWLETSGWEGQSMVGTMVASQYFGERS